LSLLWCQGGYAQHSGQISGKVMDGTTQQAVGYASVTLIDVSNQQGVSGIMADDAGKFAFSNLALGSYSLKIQFIGYGDVTVPVQLVKSASKVNLGEIKVYPSAAELQAVTVTQDKPTMALSIDRKSFNVSKDLSVKGGNGIDAVKNVPGVSVDADGTVSLRNNSNVLVFIDGRQTALSLQQIAADQIDRVEVITNPSAKYDANSSGGIINVILKKNNKPNYNGNIVSGIGTHNRYITNLQLGLKNKRFDLSTNFAYNTEENLIGAYTYRQNLTQTVPITWYNQAGTTDAFRKNSLGKIGLEYYLNPKNTLYVGSTVSNSYLNSDDQLLFSTYDANYTPYSQGDRVNNNNNNSFNIIYQLGYKKAFEKKGAEWSTNLQYTTGHSSGGNTFITNESLVSGGVASTNKQKNDVTGTNKLFILQSDVVHPFDEHAKMEYGYKMLYRQNTNTNVTSNYSYFLNDYIDDPLFSNHYLTKEVVQGLYVNYTQQLQSYTLQSGLRFESSKYQGTVADKASEDFGYDYPQSFNTLLKSIFPAVFISKKFNPSHEMQWNFTRKINRPDIGRMIPIVMATDNLNYRIGNPRLQPEFVTKAELNYNFVSPKLNVLSSLYGQYTENAFVFVFSKSPSNPNLLINTFRNGNNSYGYGWENIIRYNLSPRITFNATVNPYFITLRYTDENGEDFTKSGFSANTKFLMSIKLPKDFVLQLNGLYEAPKPLPQGSNTDLKYMDISISKNVSKNLYFNLTLSDVFDSKQRGSNYNTIDFNQRLMNRREARYLKFTISYNFGDNIFGHKSKKFNPIENTEINN